MSRLPNLFVLGAPKCGTTLVHGALDQFDEVHMSRVKEPGFFSEDSAYARGLKSYVDTFFYGADDQAWVGEATPWYLYSAAARHRISLIPGPKRFIICLRDPAARAVSMYRDQVRAGWETREAADALSPYATAPRLEQRYVDCGNFLENLGPWLEVFGQENVLILLESDLADVQALGRALGEFLNVTPPLHFDEKRLIANRSGGLRSPFIAQSLRWLSGHAPAVRTVIRTMVPEAAIRRVGQDIVRWNHSGSSDPIEVDEAIEASLRDFLSDSVLKLELSLGRSLTAWPSHPRHATECR